MLSLLLFAPTLTQAEGLEPGGTRINISATAEAELPNDEVVITFRVEQQGKNSDEIRKQVNNISKRIQQRLQKERGVKLKTTSRNMQPVWHHPKNQPRVRTAWRMTQTEQVTSTNLDAVPAWLDAIENAGAHLSNLQFRVSRERARLTQASLQLEAIKTFRKKAAALAKGLDTSDFRIIRLNTSSHTPRPVMYRSEMAMMAKASADTPAPSLSAGEGTIQVTITGEIETPFIDYPVK